MLNDQAIKGLYTELFVQKEFARYGFHISVPLFNAAKYDMIVDTGVELLKIQVKKSRQKGKRFCFSCFVINGGTNHKKTYSKNDIDYFATVWNDEVYLVPVDECSNEKSIVIGDKTYLIDNVLSVYKNKMKDEDYYTVEGTSTRYCIDCGAVITSQSIRCAGCANKLNRELFLEKQLGKEKAQELIKKYRNGEIILGNDGSGKTPNGKNYPTRAELKRLIRNKPFTQIGIDYGVSDNAIRKWCDTYGLPRKKGEINKYAEKEWNNI